MKRHPMTELKFTGTDKYYYKSNKFITHFLNALSSTFPAGEQFFVRSVRKFRTSENTELEREITRFIRDEATHTIAHDIFNKYAETYGIPIYKMQKHIGILLKIVETYLTPKTCLAITVALEHYTAAMGKEMLRTDHWLSNMDDEYRKLWEMHSKEEVDHRCVAWDVYEKNNGSFKVKKIVMIATSVILWSILSIITAKFMLNDKDMNLFDILTETYTGLYELLNSDYGFLHHMFKEIPLFFDERYHPSMS